MYMIVYLFTVITRIGEKLFNELTGSSIHPHLRTFVSFWRRDEYHSLLNLTTIPNGIALVRPLIHFVAWDSHSSS